MTATATLSDLPWDVVIRGHVADVLGGLTTWHNLAIYLWERWAEWFGRLDQATENVAWFLIDTLHDIDPQLDPSRPISFAGARLLTREEEAAIFARLAALLQRPA
jgi:hypothetical protein